MGIIWISISGTFAQNFKYGLQGGIDLSNMIVTNLPDSLANQFDIEPIITYNINGYVGFKSKGFWGLSIEPGFMQKGAIYKNENDNKSRIKINYIQLPVLFDIYLYKRISLSIGPEIGCMFSAKSKTDYETFDVGNIYNNKFELSGLIGFNYNLLKNIDIGVNYSRGLTYISKHNWVDVNGIETGRISKEYNQYFQFITRWKF